jgi:hypothetical protein
MFLTHAYQTPEEIHAANGILMAFMEEQSSWVWSLNLLQYDDHFVRFFAANMLLTKVKRHWMLLDKDQRNDIFNYLHNSVQQFALLVEAFDVDDAQAQQSLRVKIIAITFHRRH